jgi:hypothetical protein
MTEGPRNIILDQALERLAGACVDLGGLAMLQPAGSSPHWQPPGRTWEKTPADMSGSRSTAIFYMA